MIRSIGLMLALLYVIPAFSQFSPQKTYDIRRFGAKGDGRTDNTLFIQKAIDKASARGGGRVLVPEGRFVTGVLALKSGVDLHLDAGAFLLGSPHRPDYGPGRARPLLEANAQSHLSITGQGTIDGQGDALLKDIGDRLSAGTMRDPEWQTPNPWGQIRPSEENRPKLIGFTHCTDITIRGITLLHALDWVEDYKSCSGMIIDSIHVESNTMWNNDGIDLVDCKNVRLTNSFFNADDDGICLKSEDRNDSCLNIYVAHCKIRSSASAIKFGTAGRGGFHNVVVRDIYVYDTYRSAIAIECVDGGRLDSVDIRDVKAVNTGNALFIRLGHRNKDSAYSTMRHVYIGNLSVDIPTGKPDKGYPYEGPDVRFAHNIFPSSIVGLPGHPVEDVVLENIRITCPGGGKTLGAVPMIPENPSDYPECSMFGELPAWGLFVRHAAGVTLRNVELTAKEKDYREGSIFEDTNGLVLSGISIH